MRGLGASLRVVLVFLGLCCGQGVVRGQVYFTAQGSDFHQLTQYRAGGAQDTIWIYHRAPGQVGSLPLVGQCHGGARRKLVVRRWESDGWESRYVGLDSVESAPRIEYTAPGPGAYELLGIAGADTLRRRVWVMVDDVNFVRIDVQNACDGLRMSAEFTSDYGSIRYDKFTYYDMSQSPPRELNDLGDGYFSEVVWEDAQGRPVDLFGLRVVERDPPPYAEVGYRLRVRTLFGKSFSGETGVIAPVAVSAKFKVLLNADPDRPGGKWSEAGSPARGIAPIHMRLVSDSKNASDLFWLVRNDGRAVRLGGRDTLHYERTAADVEYVELPWSLFTAGDYGLQLEARQAVSGCVDTMMLRLQVDSSLLSLQAIPNAFSPNGDGQNDVFQFIERDRNVRGIREFRLQVFNRNGQSVYEYEGDVRDWSGWNGRRKGRGSLVDPGAYFYIIRAQGWDGRQYRGAEYKGVLHLFR